MPTCFADPERQTVLVALSPAPSSGEQKILAVGRLSKLSDPAKAEHVLLVLDEFLGVGLGSGLLRQLIQARDRKSTQIENKVLGDKLLSREKNFSFRLRLTDPRFVRAILSL